MNELIFFCQIFALAFAALVALKGGLQVLTGFVALQAVCANAFVLKQIDLFGWTVTGSDSYAVASLLGMSLLQEYFGKEAARRAAFASLFCLALFAASGVAHVAFIPAAADRAHAAYQTLFSPAIRIAVASLVVFWIAQRFEVWLFGKMGGWRAGLGVRAALSIGAAQALDTALFTGAGLYGLVADPWAVMGLSLGLKWLLIGCAAPVAALAKRWRIA